VGTACFVDMAEVDPGKHPVMPLTGEYDQATVAGPAMPGLATWAVDSQPVVLASLQIELLQVARWLVSRRAAVGRHAAQHPSNQGWLPSHSRHRWLFRLSQP